MPSFDFYAFDGFYGGIYVAAGDVNGDGHADVVVSADAGGGPRVKVYSGSDIAMFDFFAYPSNFTGGVRVAAGDVTGDGKADLITRVPGAGRTSVYLTWRPSSPEGVLRMIFTGNPLGSFFAYHASFTGGVFIAAGDVNGDGKSVWVTGAGAGGGPHVQVFMW